VALGHRRLAIRDLSPAGNQPMISASGRYILVYNGEIYALQQLTQDLTRAGVSFRGSSDTEVLLEACAAFGIEKTLPRLVGMFAFVLFDQQEKTLWCVRDRLGIKPFYWAWQDAVFFFGSELKALCAYKGWQPTLDRDSVASFTRFGYVPAPRTIYKNVHKLEAGHLLKFTFGKEPEIHSFWSAKDIVLRGLQERETQNGDEWKQIEELETLLKEAVECRLVADVPIGTLLSGGIDSSLVTALIVEQSTSPVHTFSIGFSDQEYNEAPYAAAVAQHLGTQHTELYVDVASALRLVETLPHVYDEPFADSSQIPTMLVCALMRDHVKVVLSGDGGDELFAGYNRYQLTKQCHLLSRIPCISLFAKALRSNFCARICQFGTHFFQRQLPSRLDNKLRKLANVIVLSSEKEIYQNLVSYWQQPDSLVLKATEPPTLLQDEALEKDIPDLCDRMQFLDLATYLPEDILMKGDRASMHVALETRVPLLDHRVVEFSWKLHPSLKLRKRTTKWALRQILYKRVPKALIERPKMGFGVPLHAWLRGPLRPWAEELLEERLLQQQGIFDPALIRATWRAHLEGADEGYPLWDILIFQSWLQAQEHVSLS
jgi:asparagine synthase (glutamine-hydrolysing)